MKTLYDTYESFDKEKIRQSIVSRFDFQLAGQKLRQVYSEALEMSKPPKSIGIMKVTVIDCSVSGHRETYYKQFAQTWAGMGYETSLIAPDGKGIQEAVAFQPVSALPLLPLPAGKPLQKKAGCTAQCSDSTAKSVQAAPESSTAESRSGLLCLPSTICCLHWLPYGCSIFCCPISGAACWFSPPCRLTTEGCPTPPLSCEARTA